MKVVHDRLLPLMSLVAGVLALLAVSVAGIRLPADDAHGPLLVPAASAAPASPLLARRTLTLHMVSPYADLPTELDAILDSTPGAVIRSLHVTASAPGAPASAVSADITLSIPSDDNKRQSL